MVINDHNKKLRKTFFCSSPGERIISRALKTWLWRKKLREENQKDPLSERKYWTKNKMQVIQHGLQIMGNNTQMSVFDMERINQNTTRNQSCWWEEELFCFQLCQIQIRTIWPVDFRLKRKQRIVCIKSSQNICQKLKQQTAVNLAGEREAVSRMYMQEI